MDNSKLTNDIKNLFEKLEKSKVEQKGYILIPSFEGYKMYELDAKRLELYLTIESRYQQCNPETSNG